MLKFMPQCLWTGISLSYYSGMLVLEISCAIDKISCGESDPQGTNKKAMLAMVGLGVGEMLGGQLIGQIIDMKGSKIACVANVIIMTITALISVAFLIVNDYNALVFATTFIWGFQDSAISTHSMEMLGFEFNEDLSNEEERSVSAGADPYAAFYFVQSNICFVI